MGESGVATADRAHALVGELAAQQRVLAAAQARRAALMLEFSQVRGQLDARRINGGAAGAEPRFTPGEFAAMEIGLAVTASKYSIQRTMAVAFRLQEEAPDVWDAWSAGDIDQDKAVRVNRALLRLTRVSSKQLLNALVVPVAVCKTAELLGRWLNQFVARVEPDQADERMRRSLDDRYVSVRPDLDGVSLLSAAMSSVDAVAVDQILTDLAGMVDADDGRTLQQRRADVLVDLLLGRADNGCQVSWEERRNEDGHEGADEDEDAVDGTGDQDGQGVQPWHPDDDFDLPPSAFRPDRRDRIGAHSCCSGGHAGRRATVTIGVVVSVQSLFGYTDAPGELADRSALVPADTIRSLAEQPGTLFYRLLTDMDGNLLEASEMGRFPSRKLGIAVGLRGGICDNPICTVPSARCDLDHLVPVPRGPTSAGNLGPKCRSDHRAKTHAGHASARIGPHTTRWQTPTGHIYDTQDDPLPVENWPPEPENGPPPSPGPGRI